MEPREYDAWYDTPRGSWIGEVEFALLRRLLRSAPAQSLIDIGCGTGYFTRRFSIDAGLRVTGVDIARDSLGFAKSRSPDIAFVAADACRLPFAQDAFDLAAAVTSLCFVADERSAVREMVRVTRGRFVVGLLNRHSLLYLRKGRGGGLGAYRGAHWHALPEIGSLFSALPVEGLEIRTAVLFPGGTRAARRAESIAGGRLPWGSFIAVTGSKRR